MAGRGLSVDVISPEEHPLEKVFGRELSDLVLEAHSQKGVRLHLGSKVARIENKQIILQGGERIEVEIVVVGIGVEPRLQLAETAGLSLDRGVLVNSRLQTSDPNIFAAGDIARWPDPHTGESIRVEHWVVAQRQGQVAAANMLGRDEAFTMVPFFWTKHFDLSIRYVGHAEKWDETRVEGDLTHRNCLVRFRRDDRDLAVATVERDKDFFVLRRQWRVNSKGPRDGRLAGMTDLPPRVCNLDKGQAPLAAPRLSELFFWFKFLTWRPNIVVLGSCPITPRLVRTFESVD